MLNKLIGAFLPLKYFPKLITKYGLLAVLSQVSQKVTA